MENKVIKLENVHLKKFFKKLYKIIRAEMMKKPNNRFVVTIKLDFGGDTTAEVNIIEYEGVFVLDEVRNEGKN